jgi:hypothetical protein
MKNVSTGFGLAVIGVGIGLNALAGRSGVQAAASPSSAVGVADAAGRGVAGPTVVWYGTDYAAVNSGGNGVTIHFATVFRAWSDGTVEMKRVIPHLGVPNGGSFCESVTGPCASQWYVISSPTDGLSAVADTNHDEVVDGADLAVLLGSWGDAPRSPFPPSDCPLNLAIP